MRDNQLMAHRRGRVADHSIGMLAGDAPSGEVSETAAGSCQVAPATDALVGSIAGAACSNDADCGPGRCDSEDPHGAGRYPGGYCSGRCLQDSDCGDAGRCRQQVGEVVGACYRVCETDPDCGREGYRCREQSPDGAKICQPGAKPLPDGVVGQACDDDSACGGAAMSCASQTTYPSPMALPDGYCSQSCVDGSDCGSGGACSLDLGAFKPGDRSGMCYKLCRQASDCRAGYECRILAVGGTDTRPKVCALVSAATGDADAGI